MSTASLSNRGTRRKPTPTCNLLAGRGECVSHLVARLVVLIAAYDDAGQALVFVTPDGGLYIEPAESRTANWLRANAGASLVGTYTTAVDPALLEDDICTRLVEINALAGYRAA